MAVRIEDRDTILVPSIDVQHSLRLSWQRDARPMSERAEFIFIAGLMALAALSWLLA